MTNVVQTSGEFNAWLVRAVLPAVEMLDAAGHKIVVARSTFGPMGGRQITVLLAIDEEGEVVNESAAELLKVVSKTGRAMRAPQPPSPN